MNRHGAAAGLLTGAVTVVVWKQLEGGLFDIYENIPGFIFSAVAVVGASLLTREPGEDVVAGFNQGGRQGVGHHPRGR